VASVENSSAPKESRSVAGDFKAQPEDHHISILGNGDVLTLFKDGSKSLISSTPDGRRETSFSDPKGVMVRTDIDADGITFLRQGQPDAIGNIAGKCEAAARDGQPSACASVKLDADPSHQPGGDNDMGHVVLKANKGPHDFLLMPNAPITGIEDPRASAPDAHNYFADAWTDARQKLAENLGTTADALPRDAVGLAVNSLGGRTQDRLHIHTDLLDDALRAKLEGEVPKLDGSWKPLGFDVNGHHYDAMWVNGEQLKDNPFKLVHDRLASQYGEDYARTHMDQQSLVVVGATKPDGTKGFAIVAGRMNPDQRHFDKGSSEEWLQGRPFDGKFS